MTCNTFCKDRSWHVNFKLQCKWYPFKSIYVTVTCGFGMKTKWHTIKVFPRQFWQITRILSCFVTVNAASSGYLCATEWFHRTTEAFRVLNFPMAKGWQWRLSQFPNWTLTQPALLYKLKKSVTKHTDLEPRRSGAEFWLQRWRANVILSKWTNLFTSVSPSETWRQQQHLPHMDVIYNKINTQTHWSRICHQEGV